jgi:short-subunit dehydrogenase
MALMTNSFLPHLNTRPHSAIINLSSFAGSYPIPYISLYSASKAMNTFFTEGISMEYPNVDVLSVRPMFVESPLSKAKKGFNVPDRRQCAHDCLKELRWTYETNAYFMHRIFAEAHQLFVPEWARRIVVTYFSEKRISKYN